jgi:hypothetical protein
MRVVGALISSLANYGGQNEHNNTAATTNHWFIVAPPFVGMLAARCDITVTHWVGTITSRDVWSLA